MLELNDIDSLEKQNLTIEISTNEFNEILEKIIIVKNIIEKEINNINDLYEKTINDLTNSFLEKHDILIKEENNIKEKLQIEVTKTKENLENFLSEANAVKLVVFSNPSFIKFFKKSKLSFIIKLK